MNAKNNLIAFVRQVRWLSVHGYYRLDALQLSTLSRLEREMEALLYAPLLSKLLFVIRNKEKFYELLPPVSSRYYSHWKKVLDFKISNAEKFTHDNSLAA